VRNPGRTFYILVAEEPTHELLHEGVVSTVGSNARIHDRRKTDDNLTDSGFELFV
jgi:hypothetical protein